MKPHRIRAAAIAPLVALLLCGLAAVSLLTSPARSAVSCTRTAALAYTVAAHSGERGTVFLADAEGSHRRALLRAATPKLAPDGATVAVSQPGGSYGLRIVNACGATLGQYFSSHNAVSGLAWSPDSAYLAAIVAPDLSENHPFSEQLVVIDVATGQTTTVAKGFLDGFGRPSFSPSTPDELAYDNSLHVDASSEVFSDVVGQPPVQVTRSGENQNPLFGPDGILYDRSNSSGATTLMRADGTQSTAVMKLNGWPVAISADGDHLLAEGAACGVVWPFTVDLAKRRVIHRFANGFAPFGITASGNTVLIAGSPPADNCGGPSSRIETAAFAGGKPRVIADGTDPSWANG